MKDGSNDDENKYQYYRVKGNWSIQARSLKNRFPKLTTYDLKFQIGREFDLFQRLQTKLDKNRNEIIDILRENYKLSL